MNDFDHRQKMCEATVPLRARIKELETQLTASQAEVEDAKGENVRLVGCVEQALGLERKFRKQRDKLKEHQCCLNCGYCYNDQDGYHCRIKNADKALESEDK